MHGVLWPWSGEMAFYIDQKRKSNLKGVVSALNFRNFDSAYQPALESRPQPRLPRPLPRPRLRGAVAPCDAGAVPDLVLPAGFAFLTSGL